MPWIHGIATSYINLSAVLVTAATEESLQSVDSIAAGGAGYSVGDILELDPGASQKPQVEVTEVSTGAVTAVRIVTAGVDTGTPGDPVATTALTGGGDDNCTLNCTYAANGWTVDRNEVREGSDRDVIMHGEGGGSDEIYVGWRTFQDVPLDYYNWELHGFTGYSALLDYDEQPGVSPGFFDGGASSVESGAYILGADASIEFWFSITPYRIIMVWKVGSNYFNAYLGLGNRFATSSEYPYPLCIAGVCSSPFQKASQSHQTSGLCDPWRTSTHTYRGPMMVIGADNQWYGVANGSISSGSFSQLIDRVVLPCGKPLGITDPVIPNDDKFAGGDLDFNEFIPALISGDGVAQLIPTEGATEDYRVLFPTVVVFSDPTHAAMMELDDIFWLTAHGGLVSEDRIIEDGVVYRAFQNCNRTENYSYLAIREV